MEIGLYYYNARYYAPTLARFLSPDTLVPDPANPQSFNRYSYVENRPLNFNDPTGHIACKTLGTEQCDESGNFVDAPQKHIKQQFAYPGNLPEPIIDIGSKTYDAYCVTGAGCTSVKIFNLSGLEAYVLEWALVENFIPGSNMSYIIENTGNEVMEETVGAIAELANIQYLGPLDSIWEAYEFAKKKSFSEFAAIVHYMNYSQAAANGGELQPLTVVIVDNMFLTGEVQTHYNGLSGREITGPNFVIQVPRFAIFVQGADGSLSQAVLISNGYRFDFQNLLNSLVGQ